MDKIICLGKNYLEHARELGDEVPEKPVIFFKPPSALVTANQNGERLKPRMPRRMGSLHYETEVVLKMQTSGRFTRADEAWEAVEAVTLGLDMTLRDLQAELKKNGHPWEMAKAFPDSAIIGPWVVMHDARKLLTQNFTFSIDGKIRQNGNMSDMRFGIAESILHISEHFELCAGDLIFTGTPAGVGAVASGQTGELKWGEQISYEVQWDNQ